MTLSLGIKSTTFCELLEENGDRHLEGGENNILKTFRHITLVICFFLPSLLLFSDLYSRVEKSLKSYCNDYAEIPTFVRQDHSALRCSHVKIKLHIFQNSLLTQKRRKAWEGFSERFSLLMKDLASYPVVLQMYLRFVFLSYLIFPLITSKSRHVSSYHKI